jgi:MFS family permease
MGALCSLTLWLRLRLRGNKAQNFWGKKKKKKKMTLGTTIPALPSMILCRIGVGLGESMFTPNSFGIISITSNKLARDVGVYTVSTYVGSTIAFLSVYAVNASQAESLLKPWQLLFLSLGVIGILFSFGSLYLRIDSDASNTSNSTWLSHAQQEMMELKAKRRFFLPHFIGFGAFGITATSWAVWSIPFYTRCVGIESSMAQLAAAGSTLFCGTGGALSVGVILRYARSTKVSVWYLLLYSVNGVLRSWVSHKVLSVLLDGICNFLQASLTSLAVTSTCLIASKESRSLFCGILVCVFSVAGSAGPIFIGMCLDAGVSFGLSITIISSFSLVAMFFITLSWAPFEALFASEQQTTRAYPAVVELEVLE